MNVGDPNRSVRPFDAEGVGDGRSSEATPKGKSGSREGWDCCKSNFSITNCSQNGSLKIIRATKLQSRGSCSKRAEQSKSGAQRVIELQQKLYCKAKQEGEFRFYILL